MNKNRLEAFTDGVMAIIITIMVLEIKVPHGDGWADIVSLWPKFLSYILSFVYVGIYWNNHHHTMQTVHSINGRTLWTNLILLFFLSLLPFSSGWIGENHFSKIPMLFFGLNLLLCAVSYKLFVGNLLAHHGKDSLIAQALDKDRKGLVSLVLYCIGIGLTFLYPFAGFAIYTLVALIWIVPDPRMERAVKSQAK